MVSKRSPKRSQIEHTTEHEQKTILGPSWRPHAFIRFCEHTFFVVDTNKVYNRVLDQTWVDLDPKRVQNESHNDFEMDPKMIQKQ